MYRGACSDKSTIEDIADLLKFSGILFVIDRGFYSAKNLKLLSANDNTYIIPVPSNTDVFRKAMRDVRYTDSFTIVPGKSTQGSNILHRGYPTQSTCMSSVTLMKMRNPITTTSAA